jgi:hypothetical protein
MARYDKDNDCRLRFSEFSDAFSPVDPYQRDRIHARESSHYPFSEKTKLLYRNLWITHFKIEQQAEVIRQRLSSRPSFSVYDAFKAVDRNDDGRISKDELRSMLEKGGFTVSH